MPHLTRRGFVLATLATGALRLGPRAVVSPKSRRILTLVYDKSLGMMRAVERVVP